MKLVITKDSINGIKTSPTAEELVQSATKPRISDCRPISVKTKAIRGNWVLC